MANVLHFILVFVTIGPLILIGWGYFKGRKIEKTASPMAFSWSLVINSSILYALAYNIIFFLQELFLALGKYWLGLKAYLYHNNHNWEGSHPDTDLMQGLGALAIFITGWIAWALFLEFRKSSSWIALFWLWLSFHGLGQALAQFASAPVATNTDTGQAMAYLELGDPINYAIAIGSMLLMVFIGYRFSHYFSEFSPLNTSLGHPFSRFKWSFMIVVLPAIIGTLLLFPFKVPPVDRYLHAVFLFINGVPLIFGFSWLQGRLRSNNNETYRKIKIWPIMILILVLLIYRLVLVPGVTLG